MNTRILGLHHVTATVDQAQPDLDFCVETLGMRLVKKTVNFDNHLVYHFYYGNERGTPSARFTASGRRLRRRRRRSSSCSERSATTSAPRPTAERGWSSTATVLARASIFSTLLTRRWPGTASERCTTWRWRSPRKTS